MEKALIVRWRLTRHLRRRHDADGSGDKTDQRVKVLRNLSERAEGHVGSGVAGAAAGVPRSLTSWVRNTDRYQPQNRNFDGRWRAIKFNFRGRASSGRARDIAPTAEVNPSV
jgi:hypothetical protein